MNIGPESTKLHAKWLDPDISIFRKLKHSMKYQITCQIHCIMLSVLILDETYFRFARWQWRNHRYL